ncbi:phosphatase domain-containing protein [Luteococcus peritonei]|uniref:Phosphatase domain-containing protein n=1 Tax=Luteococcus peritonei TaxID=88874 RepID=A0ABW4RWU5_9ACTN
MTADLSLVRDLLADHTDQEAELRILTLLQELPTEQLNALMGDDELAERLFEALDDHLLGARNHEALVSLLAVERRGELDLQSCANLIHGLQVGRTSSKDEQVILSLVRELRGEELTHLKNLLNLRNDHHDLEGLVFVDIDDEQVREELLAHFAESVPDEPVTEAKVLSDIDDTVFCKLHDKRYPKGTMYPGVLAFQEALDQGPHDDPKSVGDLTFVTARPMDFFGPVENHSRESLKKAGIADLSVMSGSLFSLVTLDRMAGKKMENIDHYVRLFPEYRMTFMGDSGQGDVKVGERLWELHPDVVDAVFIHDVVDTPEEERRGHAEHRIWFHDTYVGAANRALALGLISSTGWQHVVDEARKAFDEIAWESGEQEDRMRTLLERDIAARPEPGSARDGAARTA